MLFDWFTIVAQLFNFLILIWLLKKFLYKPILNAIDVREQYVVKQLNAAQDAKNEALKSLDELKLKIADIEQNKQQMLHDAFVEAETEKRKLFVEINNDAEILRNKLNEAICNEQLALSSEIMRKAKDEIYSVIRKLLEDMADVHLEEQIIKVFIKRLNNLEHQENSKLLIALESAQSGVIIRSAFDISVEYQQMLREAIKNKTKHQVLVTFYTVAYLTAGIELVTSGYKIEWSVYDYLVTLENLVTDLLSEQSGNNPGIH